MYQTYWWFHLWCNTLKIRNKSMWLHHRIWHLLDPHPSHNCPYPMASNRNLNDQTSQIAIIAIKPAHTQDLSLTFVHTWRQYAFLFANEWFTFWNRWYTCTIPCSNAAHSFASSRVPLFNVRATTINCGRCLLFRRSILFGRFSCYLFFFLQQITTIVWDNFDGVSMLKCWDVMKIN